MEAPARVAQQTLHQPTNQPTYPRLTSLVFPVNHILTRNHGLKVAVIENEFGEVCHVSLLLRAPDSCPDQKIYITKALFEPVPSLAAEES
jgi:hypothetical protein